MVSPLATYFNYFRRKYLNFAFWILHFVRQHDKPQFAESSHLSKKLPPRRYGSQNFCKKQKNPRKNPRKIANHPLTIGNRCDTMDLHSVILCPFVPILIYENIIPQNMAAVKRQVARKWQPSQAYQKRKQHTIRKKGCDDLYGNGQGRNVRQDHA